MRSLMFLVEARGEFREISVTVAEAVTVKGCYLFHAHTHAWRQEVKLHTMLHF